MIVEKAAEPSVEEALDTFSQTAGHDVPFLRFEKIEQYTTFRAEFTKDGDDLVFHFFLPPELAPLANTTSVKSYWLQYFPEKFERVVSNVFKVEPPRVQAQYISDMGLNSWWFRAFGFARGLAPEELCARFCAALDQELDLMLPATKKT